MADQKHVSDSLIFLGQQKDMNKFYRQASFFCMSSRFDGLPMVLLEAQSYGLPIVSFDCDTGPAEIIIHGSNGYLVECFDTSDLNFYLKKIISDQDKFKELIDNSFDNIKKFQIERISIFWNNLIGENRE